MTEQSSLPENDSIAPRDDKQGNAAEPVTSATEQKGSGKTEANRHQSHGKKKRPNRPTAADSDEKTIPPDNQNPVTAPEKPHVPLSKLSVLAILLTLAMGGGLAWHGHQVANQQQQTIASLEKQLATLKSSASQELRQELSSGREAQQQRLVQLEETVTNKLNSQQQAQQQFINQVNSTLKVNDSNFQKLYEQLAALSPSQNNQWLISQANYLVNLAGRKIWSDQDFVTARLLLKSADSSLAEINDPSLLPARQAITRDISALALISYVDYDGIALNLLELANQVTELSLIDNYQAVELSPTTHDDAFNSASDDVNAADSDARGGIWSTLGRWGDNLAKSGQTFIDKFISIEKYDEYTSCVTNAGSDKNAITQCQAFRAVVTPEQSLYIRENIRLQLFIAAQAIPRHQDKVYQQALQDVSTWIYAYFNTADPLTQAFLDELSRLQEQSLDQRHVPEKLESTAVLEHLMQTRVRSLLTAN